MANKGMHRFTQYARQVLTFAQEEAERLKHKHIGTEHLLLGLLLEERGVAGRVLRGFDLDARRMEEVIVKMKKPEARPHTGNFDLTDGTKRAMELAIDEARRMGHHEIGTEHLLLGLIASEDTSATVLLAVLDLTAEQVRQSVLEALGGKGDV